MKKILHTFLESYTRKSDLESLVNMLKNKRNEMDFNISKIKFSDMEKWTKKKETGDIVHDTGKFFSIKCGRAKEKDTGKVRIQPIIDQPEQGILGIMSRNNSGSLELLLQTKIEPGNFNAVQLSPTVQATKSNYTGVHKGKSIPYLWEFKDNPDGFSNIVSKGFQSEHGFKFYKKANDNIHSHNDDVEIISEDFQWYSLSDIRTLLSGEHYINMDTRSVLSTMDFIGEPLKRSEIDFTYFPSLTHFERDLIISSLSDENAMWSTADVVRWARDMKEQSVIEQSLLPLKKLSKEWKRTSTTIKSNKNKEFEVMAVKASIGSREVSSWCQPIVKDNVPKVYAFILKEINEIYHVFVQQIEEDFSWNGPEVGPSIINHDTEDSIINDLIEDLTVVYDSYQSEEGGRFMEQKNRYMLFLQDSNSNIDIGTFQDGAAWITLYQLKYLTRLKCAVTIEARTLLTIASYYNESLFLQKNKK